MTTPGSAGAELVLSVNAAARKLLRSVFMKGPADAVLLDRLLSGSVRHAARRVDEMQDACAFLDDLGVEPRVARASRAWLRELMPSAAAP
ncbi:MAG: DUF1932 domain-containing protein [Carbonactinosporaceae bacterium]